LIKDSNIEPLRLLFDKYGLDISKIISITTGTRYTAVMLKNGNIGVCANFGSRIQDNQSIVMIGLFKPIVRKFGEDNISLSVFDYLKDDSVLISGLKKSDYLRKCDAVILFSTTIFNDTFEEIIGNSKEQCDIFLLGPSSIMSRQIFDCWDIKIIFGTVFEKNNVRILDIIKNGRGTKYFQPYGRKIYLENVSDV